MHFGNGFPSRAISLICHRKKKGGGAENIQLKPLLYAEDKIQSNKFCLFFFFTHLIVFLNAPQRVI